MKGELDIQLWDLDGDMDCTCSNVNFLFIHMIEERSNILTQT